MGSGKSKDHESFTVAPADDEMPAATPAAIEPVTASDQELFDHYPGDEAIGPITGAAGFGEMSNAVAAAQAELEAANNQPAEQQIPQLADESNKAIHAASKNWLDGKSKAELDEMAAAAEFPHPEMVSHKALSGWLDPSYPADADYKAKIAAKSVERYNHAVAAGQVVPPPVLGVPEGHWKATPAEVLESQSAFLAAADNHGNSTNSAEALHALIDAENKLATAHCPELGDALPASKAQAKELVDARVEKGYAGNQLVNSAIEDGTLPGNADLLSRSEALKLMRESTPGEEKAALGQLISERTAKIDEKNAAQAKLSELCGGGPFTNKPLPFKSAADVIAYNNAAQSIVSVQQDGKSWNCVSSPYTPGSKIGYPTSPEVFAQGLRHGAKSLSMDQLRAAATMEGLKDTKGASRAELQNWLIGQWHPSVQADTIAAAIAAKKAQKKTPSVVPPAATPISTPSSSSSSSSSPAATPAVAYASSSPAPGTVTPLSPTAGSGKWFRKQQQMVEALKHQTASLADAPPRPPAADVAAWQFSAGPSMHLGGAHTKQVLTAPDGSLWMFKKAADNYRSLSESGASGILNRAGIPTVPVYPRTHNGQNGTVQPLIKGATTFPSDPGKWSQGDVDAIVRYHAAAWLVGDHDAKADNVLRTPSGGVVPCDHGQAFKFWGQDKLSNDYHPSATTVWNTLYDASNNGKLAPGVKVRPAAALPVIKSIEAIPDSEFRAMLEPSAKTGAAGGSDASWRPVFEKRAAAKHGKTPTTQQVADEFIAYGTKRKNTLRQEFTKFFADAKVDSADIITKVA